MSNEPGVIVICPPNAPSSGPIPIEVRMVADARTYWDNDGIIEKALTVALVRRDRPGISFLAKTDPSVLMLPDEPLPDRPSDDDLDASKDTISQTKLLDPLDFGATHPGAADYHVLAGFGIWTAPPGSLSVTDNDRRILPPDEAQSAGPAGPDVRPPPPGPVGIKARVREIEDRGWWIQAVFRGHGHESFWEDRAAAPFVSIVAFSLTPRGGASAASFLVTAARENEELVGTFAVPLINLQPSPAPGNHRVFVFFGDHAAKPFEIDLPRHYDR